MELLVVITVISVLAALLLPALQGAKTRAMELKCRSNLKQLAYALTMYVDDWGHYPGALRFPERLSFNPEMEQRFLPGQINDKVFFQLWDFLGVPDRKRGETGVWFREPFVWNCPAVPSRNFPILFTGAPDFRYVPNYGYNAAGTAPRHRDIDLGLCPMLVEPAMSLAELPARLIREINPAAVIVPANMIAFGDDRQWLDDEISPFPVSDGRWYPPLGDRHRQGANGVFCDAHVEYQKAKVWFAASDEARRRWNLDHQPHPESWP